MKIEIQTNLLYHKIINFGDDKMVTGVIIPLSKVETPESKEEARQIIERMKEIFK